MTELFCWCCLTEDKSSISDLANFPFAHNGKEIDLPVVFEACLNVNLKEIPLSSVFPPKACNTCSQQLKQAYNFREMCQRSCQVLTKGIETMANENFDTYCTCCLSYGCVLVEMAKTTFNFSIKKDTLITGWHLICCEEKNDSKIKNPKICKLCIVQLENSYLIQDLGHEVIATVKTRLGRMHKPKTFNECGICFKTFTSSKLLNEHLEEHIKVAKKTDTSGQVGNTKRDTANDCRHCGKEFDDLEKKVMHLKVAHKKIMKPFKCTECTERFGQKQLLSNHTLKHHLGFVCKFCDVKMQDKMLFWAHSFLHRGTVRPFICPKDDCSYSEIDKTNFKVHLNQIHGIVYDETVHGYHKETVNEVVNFALKTAT